MDEFFYFVYEVIVEIFSWGREGNLVGKGRKYFECLFCGKYCDGYFIYFILIRVFCFYEFL